MDRTPRHRNAPVQDLETPKFIELVRKEEVLWNIKFPGYKIENVRQEAWGRISKRFFGVSISECKSKWDNLRKSRSNNRKRKEMRELSGAPRIKKVKPFLFEEEMSFLCAIKAPEVQEGNLTNSEDDKENNYEGNNDDDDDDDDKEINDDNKDNDDLDQPTEEENSQDDKNMWQHDSIGTTSNFGEENHEYSFKHYRKIKEPDDFTPKTSRISHSKPLAISSPLKIIQLNSQSQTMKDDVEVNPTLKKCKSDTEVITKKSNGHDKSISSLTKTNVQMIGSDIKKSVSLLKTEGLGNGKPSSLNVIPKKQKRPKAELPRLHTLSEEEVDEDGLVKRNNAKVNKAIHVQEELNLKREERRKKIAEKIKESKIKNMQESSHQGGANKATALELAVANELARQTEYEEDSLTLICMSMAARLKKLPRRTANQLTLEFMIKLNEVEEEEDVKPKSESRANSPVDEGKSSPLLPHLTPKMMKDIEDAFASDDNENVVTDYNININGLDIRTLMPSEWLNDKIINFYFNLIKDTSLMFGGMRVYSFDSFFLPKLIKDGYTSVAPWTKKVDIFSFDLLLVPVHDSNHWCLATLNMKEKTIIYYDSLNRTNGMDKKCFQNLRKYLKDEMFARKNQVLDDSEWTTRNAEEIPLQTNSSDCGVFICLYADAVCSGGPMSFGPENIDYYRKRICYEIISCSLLRAG